MRSFNEISAGSKVVERRLVTEYGVLSVVCVLREFDM